MKFSKHLTLAVAAASLAGTLSANDVTFIDGGYAELCSTAAHNIDDVQWIELTGSRLVVAPLEICTLAIEEGGGTVEDLASSYINRGVLLFDDGKLDESLSDFDAAIGVHPTLAAAYVNKGYTLVALQRWADSIPAFDRGIELGAPDPARAHFNRGIAHEELGHVREAYQDYLKASELNPEWEEPKRELTRFTLR